MANNEKPLSILIVDDEEKIRSLLRLTLVRAGYEVLEAGSGGEGVITVETQKPDLVILDVMMPEMDGIEACKQIRQIPGMESLPILMLSARKDARSREMSRQAGANGYLTKPWKSEELLWRVDDALRRESNSTKHGTS
jgi:DNA-binding response OmpR family regulator